MSRLVDERVDGVRSYRALDSQFHIAIAEASGNTMLQHRVAQARFDLFVWADSLWHAVPDWDDLDVEHRDFGLTHRPIFDALASRDRDAATAAVVTHLYHGEQSYLARLDQLGP